MGRSDNAGAVRAFIPMFMTALILIGHSMGDDTPLLNAYELLRASGVSALPQVGTRFMADQEKLGQAAIPIAWGLWVFISMLLSMLTVKLWSLLR